MRRTGKKKQPSYRVVVADSRAPRDGAYVEIIGTYNPLTEPASITLDEEKARFWLSKGAAPSDRVVRILASKGIGEVPPPPVRAEKAVAEETPTAAPAAASAPAATAVAEAPAPEAAAPAEAPAPADEPAPEADAAPAEAPASAETAAPGVDAAPAEA
ncbi:MAG: 30S ribosomal protein S16 [Dehalococcoidia bacterium]